jgi:acetyltransferase-like isoleucine patch superfamily enzyme
MLASFILKIKRRENAFYAFLYRLAKSFRAFNIPTVRAIHLPLYYLDYAIKVLGRQVVERFWSVPLFKARCEKAGKNLRLPNGIPLVVGNHLRIQVGNNVTIMRTTIGASKVFDHPVLKIGNGSGIGYGTTISISKEVEIGDHCMIGTNCLIMDSDDHPINPQKRLTGEGVAPEQVKPVIIGNNVWIGSYCVVLKGVTVGDNSIISAHSVVTRSVVPNTIYAGNPARPTLRDIDKI